MINCIGYISVGSSTASISPLFKISLRISGTDNVVESVKDLFSNNFDLNELSNQLKKRLDGYEEHNVRNKIVYINSSGETLEIEFDTIDLLSSLHKGDIVKIIEKRKGNSLEKEQKVPFLDVSTFEGRITFLPQKDFDNLFNPNNQTIEPKRGVYKDNTVYIRLSDDLNYDNYEDQLKAFKEYIRYELYEKSPNSLFDGYLLTLTHEMIHDLINRDDTYFELLDNQNVHQDQLKEIANRLPDQFQFLKRHIDLGNNALFLEEMLVLHNLGVEFFTEAVNSLDIDSQPETKIQKEDEEKTSDFTDLPFSETNELGIVFPDYDFGKNKQNYETLKKIAYAPYIRFEEKNLRTQLLSLRKNDILYVAWTDKNNEQKISSYLVQEVKLNGENVILKGYNVNKLVPKEGESNKQLTTIVAEFAQQFKFKFESTLTSKPVAFRKFTGMTRFIDNKGNVRPALERGSQLKKDVTRNATLWQNVMNKKEDPDGPQFVFFEGGGMKFKSNKDNVGMYIRIGGNETQVDIKQISKPGSLGLVSAGNQELLSDSTFNLLKIGDIVYYIQSWSNNKPIVKIGIIVNKFGEGLMVTPLENALAKDYDLSKDVPVEKKALQSAYIFFNKESEVEENKSHILEDLDNFQKALKELNAQAKIESESYKILTKVGNLGIHDMNSFRKFKDQGKFILHDEPHYFYPGRKAIDIIYPIVDGKRSTFPIPQFREFEKMFKTLPYEAYKYFEKKELIYPESNPLNLDSTQLLFIRNTNRDSYFLMQRANKNRKEKSLMLKSGSIVGLHGVKFTKTDEGWKKQEEKQFHYGIVISRSENQIGVAIPKKEKEFVNNRWVYTQVGWEFVEVNITDYRPENKFEIVRLHNHLGFEKNLLGLLESVRIASKINYKKQNEKPIEEQLDEITNSFKKSGQQEMLKNSEFLSSAKNFNSVWIKINFFHEYDYDKDVLMVDGKDLDYRKASRDLYVSMLETGSIVMYRKYSDFLDRYVTKAYIVAGKDIQTGLPILVSSWEKESHYGNDAEVKDIVRTFVPEIDKIVGVGLLNETIETERQDLDGTPIKIKVNSNKAFIEDQKALLDRLIERNKEISFENSEEGLAAAEEFLKKNNKPESLIKGKKPLVIMREAQLEMTQQDAYGRLYSISKTVLNSIYEVEKNKKYKNWTKVEERLGIYTNWGDGKFTKYYPNSFKITFREWNNKENKFSVSAPEGLRILKYIKKGTIIAIQPPGYANPFRGIVVSKDEKSLKIIRLSNNPSEIDEVDDTIEYYDLWYRTANFGEKGKPTWRFVLPYVTEISFTDYIDDEQFKELKSIADRWKKKQTKDLNQIVSDNVFQLNILEKEKGIDIQQIKYSKGNLSSKGENVTEIKKYQDKFKRMYGIQYEILSAKEISEKYDGSPEFAYGNPSQFNAFKYNNTIIINSDKASLAEVFHEMTHFVLESLAIENPTLHNELLSSIKDHPRYSMIQRNYPELNGIALDEEVFSTLLGEIYSTKVKTTEEVTWEETNEPLLARFFSWLTDLLSKLFGKKVNLQNREIVHNSVKDVMYAFGEKLDRGDFNLNTKTEIKKGVPELFESNPELANAVYEALIPDYKERLNVDKYLELHKDDFAVKVLNKLINNGGIIMSSFSLAKQGFVKRNMNQKMNDVDIIIPESNDGFRKNSLKWMENIFGKGNVKLLNDFKDSEDSPYINKFFLVGEDSILFSEMKENGFLRGATVSIKDGKEWIKVDTAQFDIGKQPTLFDKNTISAESTLEAKRLLAKHGEQKHIDDVKNWEWFEQQKQQAQQLYSQYLDTIFPDSKVKDIVYHGSNQKIEQFEIKNEPLIHFGTKNAALQRGNVLHRVLLNVKDLLTIKDGMWFLGTDEGGLLKELLDRNILTIEQVQSINEAKYKAIQQSPYFHEDYRMAIPEGEKAGNKKLQEILKDKNIGFDYINLSEDKGSTSYAVPSQKQIHMLGSNRDVEEFKSFVKKHFPKKTMIDQKIEDFKNKLIDNGNLNMACTNE